MLVKFLLNEAGAFFDFTPFTLILLPLSAFMMRTEDNAPDGDLLLFDLIKRQHWAAQGLLALDGTATRAMTTRDVGTGLPVYS